MPVIEVFLPETFPIHSASLSLPSLKLAYVQQPGKDQGIVKTKAGGPADNGNGMGADLP